MNLTIKIISIDTSNSINTRNYISLNSESIFETINMIVNDTFSEDKIKQILAKMLFCGQSMDIGYRGTKIKEIQYLIYLKDDKDNLTFKEYKVKKELV